MNLFLTGPPPGPHPRARFACSSGMVMFTDCTVTCPDCGHSQTEAMPGRLWALRCGGCGTVMHPPAGQCCVFCAHGDVPCPDAQRESSCSCGTEGA